MYFDEDILLDLRLNYLNSYVDKFVIVESKYTHSGEKRQLLFDIAKYPKFKDKIDYIALENEPEDLSKVLSKDSFDEKNSKYILNALKRENFQRNAISLGLKQADKNDLIIISDVDEIPNLENLNYNKIKNSIILFKQNFYYYKFNLKLENLHWFGSKACLFNKLKSPQWLRNIKDKKYPLWRLDTLISDKKYSNIEFIENGGWHFSNMKTVEEIEKKMRTYLHHREYDINPLGKEKIKNIIKSKKSIYNLKTDMKNEKFDGTQNLKSTDLKDLPEYINRNKEKYLNWLD